MWALVNPVTSAADVTLPSGNPGIGRRCSAGTGESGAAFLLCLSLFLAYGCGPSDVRPVDLFPEDMCAYCRMAVSDHRCASEIIAESGEVFKFDDLSCLGAYRSGRRDLKIAAVFVMDYETKTWLLWEKAVVVRAGVFTPMGSGKVAFADSTHAIEFRHQHPVGGK
jgi:copper chaperone NosL